MGTWKHHGNLIIRRSTDGGNTWTEPTNSATGSVTRRGISYRPYAHVDS